MTDFWWLTHEQANKYVYVNLVHHKPINDNDNAPNQDFNNPGFARIDNISGWCKEYQNINVYRSLEIWSDVSKKDALSGPFIIDIDNERGELEDTLMVTRNVVTLLFKYYGVKENHLRLFFTGHKGFNIEVLPNALGLSYTQCEYRNDMDCLRKNIINKLRRDAGLNSQSGQARNLVSDKGTIIDVIHNYVRLHDSINKWIDNEGYKARKKIGLSLSELENLLSMNILISQW
jgi:hypothetical protein